MATPVNNPLANLAGAVLKQAYYDWAGYWGTLSSPLSVELKGIRTANIVLSAYDTAQWCGFATPAQEIIAFMGSDWKIDLCLIAGIDPKDYDRLLETI